MSFSEAIKLVGSVAGLAAAIGGAVFFLGGEWAEWKKVRDADPGAKLVQYVDGLSGDSKIEDLMATIRNMEKELSQIRSKVNAINNLSFVLYNDPVNIVDPSNDSGIRWSSPEKEVLRSLKETFAVRDREATNFVIRKAE